MQLGYVYIIRLKDTEVSGNRNPIKIGKSANPDKRERKGYAGYPAAVERLHRIQSNDVDWLDNFLRDFFSHKKIRAEWFALQENDIKELIAIKVLDRVPEGAHYGLLRLEKGFYRPPVPDQASLFPGIPSEPIKVGDYEKQLWISGWSPTHYSAEWFPDRATELVVARQQEGKSIICEAGWSPEEAYRNVCLRAESLGMFRWFREEDG